MPNCDGVFPWKKLTEQNDKLFSQMMSGGFKEGVFDNLNSTPALYDVVLKKDNSEILAESLIKLLQQVFHISKEVAQNKAQEIISSGKTICGTYTREVAEMKIGEVATFMKSKTSELQCMMERGSKHVI